VPGESTSEEELQNAFKKLDSDMDGKISLQGSFFLYKFRPLNIYCNISAIHVAIIKLINKSKEKQISYYLIILR